jgi:hypothetical protein
LYGRFIGFLWAFYGLFMGAGWGQICTLYEHLEAHPWTLCGCKNAAFRSSKLLAKVEQFCSNLLCIERSPFFGKHAMM